MNLVDKKVTHKRFGTGRIVKHDDLSIEINFATENKRFVYPDVFENHLELLDESSANSMGKIIEIKVGERKEEELKKELEKKQHQKNYQLRLEHDKLMKNYKIHAESQMVFWCDEEEQSNTFKTWKVYSGEVKSGTKKGKPNRPTRLHRNSVVLLTSIDANKPEKERRILGAYMVNERFIGKLCEDGYIPAHSKYKIQLTEQEADAMLFWEYYVNEKSPEKMTWNTGKYRYFNNLWMAQILHDIISLKTDPQEKELAQQFYEYFCKMNLISDDDLPKSNGALMRN